MFALAVFLFTITVGFVSAGLIGSAWAIATGEKPRFQLLLEPSPYAPVRALAVVIYAPLMIVAVGYWKLAAKSAAGFILVFVSLCWSFLQGVFILTQFLGVT